MRGRLVLLAVLMVAPLALAAAGIFAWSYQRERSAAEHMLRQTADAVALLIDRQLGQAEAFLKALATSPSLTTGDFRAFDTQAREAMQGRDGWVVLELPSGQEVVNTRLPPGATLPRFDLSGIWPELAAGRSIVTDLTYGPAAQQFVVAVNVPVVRDGQTIYDLVLPMLPTDLSRVLSDQHLPEGWVGTILDRAGIVVARSRSPELYVGKPPSATFVELLKSSTSGSGVTKTLEGEPVLSAWSRSPSYGWTFGIGVPVDRLAATAWRSAVVTMVLGALALVAGAVAAAAVARGISRPVEALADTAAALGRGESIPTASTGLHATDAVMAALRAASVALRDREAALRASEERFRTMLEALPHIAFVLRPDGSTEYQNRRYAEYFGAVSDDFASRLGLVHPEDRPRLLAAREAGIAAESEYAAEIRVRRHDGVYRWHAAQIRPLRRDGKIVAWLGISVDIDDIHRVNETLEARVRERTRELEMAEETLRQTQKLEAVGQLTGGVAHDFNNLLTVLSGNLELLERQAQGDMPRRLIEAAHRAIARGTRLTQSLLAFARRQSLHPETVNANRLIKEFGDLLRRAAGDAAEVQLLLSPTLDPCRIDEAHFQAALLNLVVNARDAMPAAGGRISIETENVTVNERDALDQGTQPGAFVCIKVSDTGAGMSPEVMTHAFEPFFTTKDIGKGSGLGLSQVYGFAKQSGGFIRLASELGVGTTVRLYLPRSQGVAAPDPSRAAGAAPGARTGRTETILVVEDDADVRVTVAESLGTLGYDVVAAGDGLAALALLERGVAADLLFSDVSMPSGMAGDELARRAVRLRRGLKVLLTSGYAAARSGAPPQDFAVLAKPYRQDELARAIRAALDA